MPSSSCLPLYYNPTFCRWEFKDNVVPLYLSITRVVEVLESIGIEHKRATCAAVLMAMVQTRAPKVEAKSDWEAWVACKVTPDAPEAGRFVNFGRDCSLPHAIELCGEAIEQYKVNIRVALEQNDSIAKECRISFNKLRHVEKRQSHGNMRYSYPHILNFYMAPVIEDSAVRVQMRNGDVTVVATRDIPAACLLTSQIAYVYLIRQRWPLQRHSNVLCLTRIQYTDDLIDRMNNILKDRNINLIFDSQAFHKSSMGHLVRTCTEDDGRCNSVLLGLFGGFFYGVFSICAIRKGEEIRSLCSPYRVWKDTVKDENMGSDKNA